MISCLVIIFETLLLAVFIGGLCSNDIVLLTPKKPKAPEIPCARINRKGRR